jgi:hypothetical protein
VWARNLTSHIPSGRTWHMTPTGHLRKMGVNTPTYRSDSWEIDWSKRDVHRKLVWARNISSKMATAREWHWIGQSAIARAGLAWKPVLEHAGRYVNSRGYVVLSRMGMTNGDIAFAEELDLFKGARRQFVWEHQLVAARKYGGIPPGHVVRHLNGNKTDNRPDNLVLGSHKENQMDHQTARVMMIYWRERCEMLEREIALLRATSDMVHDGRALALVERALNGDSKNV